VPERRVYKTQLTDEELVRRYAVIWLATITPPTGLQCGAWDPPLHYSTLRRRGFTMTSVRYCAHAYLRTIGRAGEVSTVPPKRGRR